LDLPIGPAKKRRIHLRPSDHTSMERAKRLPNPRIPRTIGGVDLRHLHPRSQPQGVGDVMAPDWRMSSP